VLATVPTMIISIIDHILRTIAPMLCPARSCQTLVTNDGTIRSAAAATGDRSAPRTPIATVGSPMPVTPLTIPAAKKVTATAAKVDVDHSIVVPFAPISAGAQCGYLVISLRLCRRLNIM
jgi:hypothetical protein